MLAHCHDLKVIDDEEPDLSTTLHEQELKSSCGDCQSSTPTW